MVRIDDWTNAQSAVIGSALIDPACVPIIMSSCAPEDFGGEYRTLLDAIRDLAVRGQPVDPVTVLNVTGPAYRETVLRLMNETPTAANVTAYIDVCKEQSRLTRLAALGAELTGAATLADARETLQKAQAVSVEQDAARIVTMPEALAQFYADHQGAEKEYISTGFRAMDERLTLDLGDVLVLGGYPSDGKTALMLQWCWQIARRYPVGIFSFETSAQKIMDRLVTQAIPDKLRFGDVKHSSMDTEQWRAVTANSVEISKRPVQIVEAAGMSAEDVLGVTLARGFKVIALDYVQLIRPGTVRKGGTRAEEVAEISKALALMARRHKLLVIELSQLQRPQKKKDGSTPAPTLSSLRESGQLEQDADVVALLYRQSTNSQSAYRDFFIAKNKEGEIGLMTLRFEGSRQRFAYVAKGDEIPKELAVMEQKRKAAKYGGDNQTVIGEVRD